MEQIKSDTSVNSYPAMMSASAAMGAVFKFYTSVAASSRALITDIDYGKTAIALAKHFEQIICICSDESRAKILSARLKKNNVTNVLPVVGLLTALPLQSGSFNNIIIHKLSDYYIKSHAKNILRSCSDLCVEDGEVYISVLFSEKSLIKKLFLWPQLLMAVKISKLFTQGRIHHYPSIADIIFLRLINTSSIQNIFFELKRIINSDNIGFVLSKSSTTKPSLSQRIKHDIESKIGKSLEQCQKVLAGSHASVICDFGSVIVRLPQSIVAIDRCHINFDNLSHLHKLKLPFATPEPLLSGVIDNQHYFVESKLSGKSLDTHMSTTDFQAYQHLGAELLLHPDMPVQTQTLAKAISEHCIQDCVELKQYLTSDQAEIFEKTIRIIKKIGQTLSIPQTIQHGDFKYSNFLCSGTNPKAITGVIDWDMGTVTGLPLMDILTVSIYKDETEPKDFAITILNLTHKEPPNQSVRAYCDKLSISTQQFNLICFFLAIRYINRGFSSQLKSQKQWQEAVLKNQLIPACESLSKRYGNE